MPIIRLVVIITPGVFTPRAVMRALEADDIESRPVWRPMHTQPLFRDAPRVGGEVAERLYNTGICLPSSSSLSESDQDRVIARLRTALGADASARVATLSRTP